MLGLQSLRHGLCDSPGQSGKASPRQQCLSCGQNEQGSQPQTRKNSEHSWGVGVGTLGTEGGEVLPSEERQEVGGRREWVLSQKNLWATLKPLRCLARESQL